MKKIKQEILNIAASTNYSEMQLKFDIYLCKVKVSDLIDIFNIVIDKDFAKANNNPYRYSYFYRNYVKSKKEWEDDKCEYAIDALVKLVDTDNNLKKKISSLGFIRELNKMISSIDFKTKGENADLVFANIMAKLMDFGSKCCNLWIENKNKGKIK